MKNELYHNSLSAWDNAERIGRTGVVTPQLLDLLQTVIITRAAALVVQAALEGKTYTIESISNHVANMIGVNYVRLLIQNGTYNNYISQGIQLGNNKVIREMKGLNMNQYGMNNVMAQPMMNNQPIMVDQFGRPIVNMQPMNMMPNVYGAVIPQQNTGMTGMPTIVQQTAPQVGMGTTANAYSTEATNRFSNAVQTPVPNMTVNQTTQVTQQVVQTPKVVTPPPVVKDLGWICAEGISVENGEAVGTNKSKKFLELISTNLNEPIEEIIDKLLIYNTEPFSNVEQGKGYRCIVHRDTSKMSSKLNLDEASRDFTSKINLITSDVIEETEITSSIEDTEDLLSFIEENVRSIYKREQAIKHIKEIKSNLDTFMSENVQILVSKTTGMSKWISSYSEDAVILYDAEIYYNILKNHSDTINSKLPLRVSNHTYPELFNFLEKSYSNIESPFLSLYLVSSDGCYKTIVYRPEERLGKYGELVYKLKLSNVVDEIKLV